MNFRVKNSVGRWAVLAAAVIASGVLGRAAIRHAVTEHWAGSSNPEQWLRAAQLEPSNPENWYHLGRYRQFDIEHTDLPMAISYYQRATLLNPASASYWMDLAAAYEVNRNSTQAEQAFRVAQQVYPISGEVAWRFGNFLLRQGRTDEAFEQIRRAVSVDPKLTSLAVSICWRSTGDINRILTSALPSNPDVYWGAIDFFLGVQEIDAATVVWTRLSASGAAFSVPKVFPLIDALIQLGRVTEAKKVWQQGLAIAGVKPAAESQSSLIWNGGFEGELFNGGFDWRYRPVDGADVSLDIANSHGGNRSLRVVFDGKVNVTFDSVQQYVVVEPGKHYQFSAFMRSQELTTDSGIRFLIEDYSRPENSPEFKPDPSQFTSNVIGTRPWTLESVEFTTGSQTNLLRITLLRSPSNRFGNKISGTAWVDDVSLTQFPAPSGASQ